jgi:sodium/proline symporter
LKGGLFDVYEILPGFIVSTLAIFLFSLMQSSPGYASIYFDDQQS